MVFIFAFKQPSMKRFYLTLVFSILSLITFSQTYQRMPNESAEAFAKRIFKVDELAHPIIETKEWDSARKVIFAFIEQNFQGNDNYDENKESCVIGYCFIPISPDNFKRTLIDTFHENGGLPWIEAVFFANTDKDKEREIGILVRTDQIHRGAGVDGNFYDTYIYDKPDLATPSQQLKLFESLSSKFTCFDGSQGNKDYKGKYKNVASIRAALKQMGY
jgi:hypothetical protein